tara:strand:- start:1247 stop:1555 length:309 start_codon:yes stop_codon:yes gene_type:complete
MRYNFDEIIKERLENRYLWRSYLKWLLTHKDLTIYAKKEFYKNKPFLALIIKLYFLPYNLLRYFIYISEKHRLDMINKEIEILNEFQVDKNGTKSIEGESND